MNIKIQFETGNAAFEDAPEKEIARILRGIIERIADGACPDGGSIRDYNGNRIGEWSICCGG